MCCCSSKAAVGGMQLSDLTGFNAAEFIGSYRIVSVFRVKRMVFPALG